MADHERPFHLEVDASAYAMGGCLYQVNKHDKSKKDIIAFYSKAFDAEKHGSWMRASPFYREAMALAHMVKEVSGIVSHSKWPLVGSPHGPFTPTLDAHM